jgi:hypothetical protein
MAAIGARSKPYDMVADAAGEAASGGFMIGSAPACAQHESADWRNEGGSAAGPPLLASGRFFGPGPSRLRKTSPAKVSPATRRETAHSTLP